MDMQGLRDELRLVNWMSDLIGSVEDCWRKFKSILLELRNKLGTEVVKKQQGVFRKYKNRGHLACQRVFKIARWETKRAKYNFGKKMAENIKKIVSHFMLMSKVRKRLKEV